MCTAIRQTGGTAFSDVMVQALGFPVANNTTLNGCNFVGVGTCQVRGGTGLPVELMEFSVEDGEESAEGEPEPDAGG